MGDCSSIAERTRTTLARVRAAEVAAGRAPGSVRLIGASKTRTPAEVAEAHAAGLVELGENYAQELLAKAPLLPAATWHFIGHLQRNKAKVVVDHASWLHTLDSERLADHVDRLCAERGSRLSVLIEVNVGGESTKAGLVPEGLLALAQHIVRSCGHLDLRGLMTIPPPRSEPRAWFSALATLQGELAARLGAPLPDLSMGMTDDLEDAIACGATLVRVGTGIFGPRTG